MFRNDNGVNTESFRVVEETGALYLRRGRRKFRWLNLVAFGVSEQSAHAEVLVFRRKSLGRGKGSYMARVESQELLFIGGHDYSPQLHRVFGHSHTFIDGLLRASNFKKGDVVMVVGAPKEGATLENISVFGKQ